MIDHPTVCVHAACAWAWILTPLIDTRRIRTAVRADHALRSARRWATDVVGLAGADRMIVNNTAIAIRSAGRRLAGIARHWRYCKKENKDIVGICHEMLDFVIIVSQRRDQKRELCRFSRTYLSVDGRT